MDIVQKQADIIATIQGYFPNLAGIYLFGSAAKGQSTEESDLDLALLLPQTADPIALWDCAQSIASLVNQDVDLVDLKAASTVFQIQVIYSGERIFTVDELACQYFEALATSMYMRLNEERAGIIEAIQHDKRILS